MLRISLRNCKLIGVPISPSSGVWPPRWRTGREQADRLSVFGARLSSVERPMTDNG